MMRGGTIDVPGGTGAGEFAGATAPPLTPAYTVNRFGKALLGLEAELEDDIFNGVIVVVDLDLVEDVRVEREPVRTISRLEQRIDPEDECHVRAGVRTAVALERI